MAGFTSVSLSNGREVDVALSENQVGVVMASAVAEGKPFVQVPTITGTATLVAHQVVGWWPKSSGASRPAQGSSVNQGAAGGGGKKHRR